jgi:acyl CoA:acetate/3-ketoacid CoA transferase beta subunit
VLAVDSQEAWLDRLGGERVASLRARADVDSWQADEAAFPPDLDAPTNGWERAAVFGARYLADRIAAIDADAVLAGAGVANLSAWLGVAMARACGSEVTLTAEIGLWGYEPVPADPFVLNHRNFPSATMLADAGTVLGSLVGGAGTTTIGCLGGAQIDRAGNINSTLVPGGAFLVGSGGGNDVASVAAECVVVATLNPPGRVVRALVTDLGLLEKVNDDELILTAVPAGPEPIDERIERARGACGWDLRVSDDMCELPAPGPDEVAALRKWDPRGWFLRAR